ncbi:MAG TPA: hypothetical protein VHX42_01610 [Candidatus Babeliales bacterium]|jgi:hypothetical protein|nr:hypothetical protein [Candidatus Babeliales bacterium]
MKIRNNYLIACTLIMQIGTSLSMNIATTIAKGAISSLCSTTEMLLTCAPLLDKYLFNPADIRAEKLKNVQSNAPETITAFITKIAQSRNIHNVKVILSDDYDYSTNDNGNIILIPNKYVGELETLLSKSTLTTQEKEQLDEHTGIVHHELTHGTMRSLKYAPIYDAAIGTVGAASLSATLTRFTHTYFPGVQKSFTLRNVFKLARGAFALPFAFKLMNMNMYKKYDELKADDGIPNQKDLLTAHMKRHEKRHDIYLHWVDTIKKHASFSDIISPPEDNDFSRPQLLAMKTVPKQLFNQPLVMDAVFHANTEHPSDLRRANRFKDRLAKL